MHAHQTRQDGVAFEIEYLHAGLNFRTGAWGNRLDLSVADHDGLILERCGCGAVDHAHMDQRDHRRLYADELLAVGRGRLGQTTDGNCEKQEESGCDSHGFSPIGNATSFNQLKVNSLKTNGLSTQDTCSLQV